MNESKQNAGLTNKQVNAIIGTALTGGGMASHYFGKLTCGQYTLPTEAHYNILQQHMDLKPYDEIKQEYESLRRTFKLSPDKQYTNTWKFTTTHNKKQNARHPCEKPEELISHIIDVSSNENDVVVDMFCGSCVVPKCCEKMNRKCIAGDIDDTYFEK